MKHVDEMDAESGHRAATERARGRRFGSHSGVRCLRTLLRAMERESRLLPRAMLEKDEPGFKVAQFQERARKSMQWLWGLVSGWRQPESTRSITGYVQPWRTNWKSGIRAARNC